ncbi:MAG TPA: DUF5777 family beta-barrel protein [Ferruginibacter sp.]|nr:DUF5777 family beta-barrel protein [Ferruginibacter sp.]
MRRIFFVFCMLTGTAAFAQTDSSASNLLNELEGKQPAAAQKKAAKVFMSHRLINANTTEMLTKGHLEFKVVHNFGDIGGTFGGVKNAFGLDNSTDIKIGFAVGVTKNLNIMVSRNKGFGNVTQLWEMAAKYRIMQQMENDPSRPLSIALFANGVASSVKHSLDSTKEHFYPTTSSRQSQVLQLMIARKFGKILSFQLNPTYVHTNYVVPGDVKNIFAFGAAIRVPIYKQFVFIADYFHPFRSGGNTDNLKTKYGVNLYDVWGVGLELVTPGHVFHVNFTNTHSILENRFLTRTTTNQFRWGFTVARDFVLFKNKKKK